MIKVYGIPNCNTVKKAIDWLKENKLPYEFHDYKKAGITVSKLNEWSNHFGWENVLNKKGTTWQALTEDKKGQVINQQSAVALMAEQTSMIKRPIIEAGEKYLIRFDEKQYEAVLLPLK